MNNYFRYENQPCPICNNSFNPNDDIVVCPICGTPHHRDCYKKNGECGNFEKHNEGYRWTPLQTDVPEQKIEQSAPVPEAPYAVPFNSAQAPTTNIFTAQPNPYALFPKELEDGVATEEAADFVQLNNVKYIQNFFYIKSKKKTFNWAAFFFAPYWFFYRKMYKLGAIFMAIMLLLSVGFSLPGPAREFTNELNEWAETYENADITTTEEMEEFYNSQYEIYTSNPIGVVLVAVQGVIAFILQLYIGFNANKWYYNHTIKSIKKVQSETADPNHRKLLYFKAGGMSMGAAFLAVLADNIVIMAIEMLFTFI